MSETDFVRVLKTAKRLTTWNGKKYVLPQGAGAWRVIADRLAAYENTGLTPEEIEELKEGLWEKRSN